MAHDGDDDTAPLPKLVTLSRSHDSGELIVAGPSVEVHVYLLRGRVAWATSSKAPNALARYLVDECDVPRDALAEVVAECRRTGDRFGETLVAWGVATLDQVRDALRLQIREALATLQDMSGARTLFLRRHLEYAEALTFPLDEVRPAEQETASAREIRASIVEGVPRARWADVLAVSGPRADRGRPYLRRLISSVAPFDADSVTVRTAAGALLGRRLADEDRWAFVAVPADVPLGLARVALDHATGGGPVVPAPEPARRGPTECFGAGPWVDVVRELVDNTDEAIAAFVLDEHGLSAARRADFDTAPSEALARACDALLDDEPPLQLDETRRTFEYAGVSMHIHVTGRSHYATALGGEPDDDHTRRVWLTLQSGAPQGFGWALLATISRSLRANRG